MIRDPRDIVVSGVFYMLKKRNHEFHDLFSQCPNVRSCIEMSIVGNGAANLQDIRSSLMRYAGWIDCPEALTVRFEDLIGERGGGSAECQMHTIEGLFEHIGVQLDASFQRTLKNQLFSSASPTFRKGRIGGWVKYFDADLRATFKDVANDILIKFGYETDADW
jgi:hypothetical protein